MKFVILLVIVFGKLLMGCGKNLENKTTTAINECKLLTDKAFPLSLYSDIDSLHKSLNYLDKAILLCENNIAARESRFKVNYKLGNHGEVFEDLEYLINKNPNNFNYHIIKGLLSEERGDSLMAANSFTNVENISNKKYALNPSLENYLGLLYLKLFSTKKEVILAKLDSLESTSTNKSKDSLIHLTTEAVRAFDKKNYLSK